MRYIYDYEVFEGVNIAVVEYIPPYKVLIHLIDGRTIEIQSAIRHECINKPSRDECAILEGVEYEPGER